MYASEGLETREQEASHRAQGIKPEVRESGKTFAPKQEIESESI